MIGFTAVSIDWLGRVLIVREAVVGLMTLSGVVVSLRLRWQNLVRPRWPSRRRAALRDMQAARRFHRNPRLLIADVARRFVGLAIVGSAILLNDAMYASDHIHALAGRPIPALKWELAMGALTRVAFVILLILGGARIVERMDRWADIPKARRAFLQRHGRRRIPPEHRR